MLEKGCCCTGPAVPGQHAALAGGLVHALPGGQRCSRGGPPQPRTKRPAIAAGLGQSDLPIHHRPQPHSGRPRHVLAHAACTQILLLLTLLLHLRQLGA